MTAKDIIRKRAEIQKLGKEAKDDYINKLRTQLEAEKPEDHEATVVAAWNNFQQTQKTLISFDNLEFKAA